MSSGTPSWWCSRARSRRASALPRRSARRADASPLVRARCPPCKGPSGAREHPIKRVGNDLAACELHGLDDQSRLRDQSLDPAAAGQPVVAERGGTPNATRRFAIRMSGYTISCRQRRLGDRLLAVDMTARPLERSTRAISPSMASRSGAYANIPVDTTASNIPVSNGSCSIRPSSRRMAASGTRARASATICAAPSTPQAVQPRCSSASTSRPEPIPTSRAVPGPVPRSRSTTACRARSQSPEADCSSYRASYSFAFASQ